METDLSFQQAVQQLQAFLQAQKQPCNVCWIFRDDLLVFRRRTFLRWPLPKSNEQQAERLFSQGKMKKLGMALEVWGFDSVNAYSYVLVPEDEADAEAMMMTDLKFSYSQDREPIIKVRTSIVWWILKRLLPVNACSNWINLIPLPTRCSQT